MRGLEPALVLAALALAAHGAWRFAAGPAEGRFAALFDIALAACAAAAPFLWRAEGRDAEGKGKGAGAGAGGDGSVPTAERAPSPGRDFLFYAVPALGVAAVAWYVTR